ncbi:MAG: FTR1 family protein [Pseudonocardia sp.]|nr:FTR1 family protein [Pseudonocardia sp.]
MIGLREGLEAGLVVSILLAAVRRVGDTGADGPAAARALTTRPVWLGVAAATSLTLSFGAVLTFYRAVLPTRGQEALGGALSVLAVVLVTAMIFWMKRAARSLSDELRAQVANAVRLSAAALAMTAFLAVGREGLETALFLWAAAQAAGQGAGQAWAPAAGAGLGVALAVVLCVLLYRRAVRIRLAVFFNRTAILLIIIAAGVLAYGLGDLQDAGLLPGHAWVAFDLSGGLDPSAWWVSIITGITELSVRMSWLQVVCYVGYLLVVITLFVRAGPTPGRQPPAVSAQAPDGAAGHERAERLLGNRTAMGAAVAAVLVLPPLVAAALILLAPGARAAGQRIEVTDTACAPGWSRSGSSPGVGAQTFTVVNRSGHAAEINLVEPASQGVLAEIETLGPGTSQSMPVVLPPGDYAWRCLITGLPTTTSAAVHITGGGPPAPAAVTPVDRTELTPPLRAYNAYTETVLAELAGQVGRVRADLAGADVAAAQRDWLDAELSWERVGAAYGSFGDFGDAIGGKPQGLPAGVADPGFTGLHRLEYGLWHGQPAAELESVADRLSTDIAGLRAQLPQVSLDPADLPVRAHEILEDALRDHLTGATDQGAGAQYAETYADVAVTRVVLGELSGLVTERDPRLLPTAYQRLDTLERALLATRVDGAWQPVAATPLAGRERVDAAIGAALETLARVPDLLEVPAHGPGSS